MSDFTDFVRQTQMDREEKEWKALNRRAYASAVLVEFVSWMLAFVLVVLVGSVGWMGLNKLEDCWRSHGSKAEVSENHH